MTSLDELLDHSLAQPLAFARSHVADGNRAVGFLGADVPVELILAANALPVNLTGAAGRPTPRADKYLEPSFAPLERSIAEQWLSGELDFLSDIVLSRARDSSQRLYYYICELQRRGSCPGPTPLLYDIAKIQRPTSLGYTAAATRRLAGALGSDLTRTSHSIETRNRRRSLLGKLQHLRGGHRPPSGSFVERILRSSDQSDALVFDRALDDWIRHWQPGGSGMPPPRFVLAGSMPPDERLHVAVENAGGMIVAEFGDHAVSRFGDSIAGTDDPLSAIAAHYHALPYGPRMFCDRTAALLDTVRTNRAHGVVMWLLEEEEALIWDLPAQARALGAAQVPILALSRCRWDASDGATPRIHEFVVEQGGVA